MALKVILLAVYCGIVVQATDSVSSSFSKRQDQESCSAESSGQCNVNGVLKAFNYCIYYNNAVKLKDCPHNALNPDSIWI